MVVISNVEFQCKHFLKDFCQCGNKSVEQRAKYNKIKFVFLLIIFKRVFPPFFHIKRVSAEGIIYKQKYSRVEPLYLYRIGQEMTTISHDTSTRIRIFRFLETSWTQIVTGFLSIDTASQVLKIYYENSSNNHLIPNCTPKDVPGSQKKVIQVAVSRMTKIESDDSDLKIMYLWIDNNPFSISFLSEQKAKQCCQTLQLLQQSSEIMETQNEKQQTSTAYLLTLMQTNPGMLTTLFINNNLQVLQILLKLAQLTHTQTASPQQKQNYFLIFKSAIRVGDIKMIQNLISKDNYPIVLKILSWNPFNKIPFDYAQEFQRLSFHNLLDIQDKNFVESYEENARVRFLRDVAGCMFTEIDNERVFQNIINLNNQTILFYLGYSDKIFQDIKSKSQTDPIGYLNLIAELWQMFKSTNIDFQNKDIKQRFVLKFKQKKLHNATITACFSILDNPIMKNSVTSRFHERWLESFNTFLSHNWEYSQEWICQSNSRQCLVRLLCRFFSQPNDQNLIETLFTFVKWMVEPSQNRMIMSASFKCYLYQQLILKMWPAVKQSPRLIQLYVDFILRSYKVDCIRTRRTLIENKVLGYLNKDLSKKSILICVIKLLSCFVDDKNYDIFTYLTNREYFKGLRQQYLRNVRTKNIINSCFRGLLSKVQVTESKLVRQYFEKIFLTKEEQA